MSEKQRYKMWRLWSLPSFRAKYEAIALRNEAVRLVTRHLLNDERGLPPRLTRREAK